MYLDHLTELILSVFTGLIIGSFSLFIFHRVKLGTYETIAKNILQNAETEALNIKRSSEMMIKQHKLDHSRELENVWQTERKKLQKEEERITLKEDKVETRMNLVEKKLSDIEKREAVITLRKVQLDEEKQAVNLTREQLLNELEKISGLSAIEAKEILIIKKALRDLKSLVDTKISIINSKEL